MSVERSWYFAYGSNLNPTRMKSRVGSYGPRRAAVLHGYALNFNKPGGFATIQEAESSIVEGAVYKVSDKQLEQLDGFEGVPQHYRRMKMIVHVDNDEQQAWVYVATKPSKTDLQPTWEYLSHLLAGVDVLSQSYAATLQWWPTRDPSVFFVYGSLRPDDDSGMPWTSRIMEHTVTKPAQLPGARLYQDQFACVVLGSPALPTVPIGKLDRSITEKDLIIGHALRLKVLDAWTLDELTDQLDQIEGYPSLYQRDVVSIVLQDGARHQAYVYHRSNCNKDDPIPSGDWLDRTR